MPKPDPMPVVIADDGTAVLEKLRQYPSSDLSDDIEDLCAEVEEWIDASLRSAAKTAEEAIERQRREISQQCEALSQEIREMSSNLGRAQAEMGALRSYTNQMRNHTAALLSSLQDAWWLNAAHAFSALTELLRDNPPGL